jgi:hypothetical protein
MSDHLESLCGDNLWGFHGVHRRGRPAVKRGLLLAASLLGVACVHAPGEDPAPEQLVPIDQVAGALQAPEADRPVVLFVGFHNLFEESHIPGAIDLGPGTTPEGLAALERELRSLAPDREVLIYCGCCPADHCPNIRPALGLARKLGFGNVRVVEIPKSFRNDWIKRGLPVEKGGA